MIVKILRCTAVQGEVLTPGELVDVPETDARTLIAYGKASESSMPVDVPEPGAQEEIQHRDPKRKK